MERRYKILATLAVVVCGLAMLFATTGFGSSQTGTTITIALQEQTCDNPYIVFDDRTWHTSDVGPAEWKTLKEIGGVITVKGDSAMFVAEDNTTLRYRTGWSTMECLVSG